MSEVSLLVSGFGVGVWAGFLAASYLFIRFWEIVEDLEVRP